MENSRQSALINSIMQIGHGDMAQYAQAVLPVEDPGLLAHLIAYTAKHGKVRDVKVALPVCAMHGQTAGTFSDVALRVELAENAVGHLLLLPPRDLRRAAIFHDQLKRQGRSTVEPAGRTLRRGVESYLRLREKHRQWFTRSAIQDRHSLTWLYDHFHVKPIMEVQAVLFDGQRPAGTTFEAVARLHTLTPEMQASVIQQARIPFTVAVGSVSKATDPVILRALIDAMTGTEVVTNAKMLQKWTANDAACRGAFEAALERATKSGKTETLKAAKAAEQVGGALASRLQNVTEAQIEKQVKPLDCDVQILADRSGSMHAAVETGKRIAALVARRTTGKVRLTFFNVSPVEVDVTGKTLAEIEAETRMISANGGTSIGCGLAQAEQKGFGAALILVVSDGAENTPPMFVDAYRRYERSLGLAPSVTLIRLPGEFDVLTGHLQVAGISLTRYEFSDNSVDNYNLPEIVNALRPGTYGLLDDVLATPLLTVAEALARSERMYA